MPFYKCSEDSGRMYIKFAMKRNIPSGELHPYNPRISCTRWNWIFLASVVLFPSLSYYRLRINTFLLKHIEFSFLKIQAQDKLTQFIQLQPLKSNTSRRNIVNLNTNEFN